MAISTKFLSSFKSTNMLLRTSSILFFIFLGTFFCFSQSTDRKSYRNSNGKNIYLPLGKISFADTVVDFYIGTPKPLRKFRNPEESLKEPDYTSYSIPSFFSLGCGGNLTVKFTDNGFMNLAGKDIYIFEVGPAREPAKVEISKDGIEWIYAGEIDGGRSVLELSDQNIDTTSIFYYLRVTDLKSLCVSKSAGADIDAIAAINSVVHFDMNADVLFDVGKSELKPKSIKTLDSISKIMIKIGEANLSIVGHTDSDGTEEYNYGLSYNRCYSVREKLKNLLGNSSDFKFSIKGLGESFPKAPNDSDINKQINRRVEITLLPPNDYYGNIP